MKLKTLALTVGALAAASVAVYFVNRPAPPPIADTRVNQSLVDGKLVEAAAKFRISDQGKTVTLARQSDGSWRVASYHDLPADFSKLSSFVGSLTDAKIQRLVTSNAEKVARLEFKDTKIELLDAADKSLWTATLGKNAETGGGRFVRFGDEQKAYLANLNAWLDPESKNWANTELLALKADDIAKLELTFPEGAPVTVTRAKKEDPWTSEKTPEGQRVKADKVSQTLGSFTGLRFSETTATDDPAVAVAKASQRTLKLTTFDGKTFTVALSRKPEEKKPKPAATKVDDTAKKDDAAKAGATAKQDDAAKAPGADATPAKPAEPEFDTVPAGPVFVAIASSDTAAPVNALMAKRAYQIPEYIFTGLPQKSEELFEPAPAAPPAPTTPVTAPISPTDAKAPVPKAPEPKK